MKTIRDNKYYKDQVLDIYVPDVSNGKSLVYFHGGGIEAGDKCDPCVDECMLQLCERGFLVFNANYSLYPNTKYPEFLVEAANAVKYAFDNNKLYGGNDEIYVSGQSAGSYIIMMLCCNKKLLTDVGINPLSVKGWISDDGQLTDHFNIQKYELGLDPWVQRISEKAPLYYIDPNFNSSPIILIYTDEDMLNRKEHNFMFYNSVKFYNDKLDISLMEYHGPHCVDSCRKDDDGIYPYVKKVLEWTKTR